MTNLQARMIFEMLGRPKNHIEDTLKSLIKKMESKKGVKITESKFNEAVPVKDAENLFTTFCEITVELNSIDTYFALIFGYMPANIEVIYPESVTLTNQELNFSGNRLIQRLHEYDSIVKTSLARQDILTNKLKEVAPHLFQSDVPQTIKNESFSSLKDSKKSNKKSKRLKK